MNAFRRVRELLTFTKNEQKIFIFLSVVFLAGAGIKAYRMAFEKPEENGFDYTQADSVFASRSSGPVPLATGHDQDARGHRSTARAPGDGHTININTAAITELMRLPGVGETTAARIVSYRTEHGLFRAGGELKRVRGIGQKKFEKIRALITVRTDSSAAGQ